MKTTTRYSNKSFGTGENAQGYSVKIQRFGGETGDIHVEFCFDETAEGRGVGYLAGNVKSVALQMPIGVFSMIADRIAAVGSCMGTRRSEFHVDERSHQ